MLQAKNELNFPFPRSKHINRLLFYTYGGTWMCAYHVYRKYSVFSQLFCCRRFYGVNIQRGKYARIRTHLLCRLVKL